MKTEIQKHDASSEVWMPTTPAGSNVSWPSPLLDIIYALVARRYAVTLIVVVGVCLGAVRLVNMPSIYRASAVAVLMPREKPMLDAAIDTSSVESTDDRAGRSAAGNLMLPPNPKLYTTLIKSRVVIERIAETFSEELGRHLSPKDRSEEVYYRLKSMISVASTEDGLMTITVSSETPRLSALIANELFAECERASKAIERQLIIQQAGHLDNALESARERLLLTERSLQEFSASFGLIDMDLQAGNKLRSLREQAALRDGLESDLQELLLTYSEKSPEVKNIRVRLAALDKQTQTASASIVGPVGVNEFGGVKVAHESLIQKARFERDLVAILATKSDIYRIRAEQPTGNIAIIRPAEIPDRPAGPSKKKELGIAIGISIFLALGWAFACQQWDLANRDVIIVSKLNAIKSMICPIGESKKSDDSPIVVTHKENYS